MNPEIKFTNYLWSNRILALLTYASISSATKSAMADTYREAFGGKPWYEKYICPKCNNYLKEQYCPNCNLPTQTEAYPNKDLIKKYFPKMLTTYVPGMLSLARSNSNVVGFTTGGFVQLDQLIDQKYQGQNPTIILDSISTFFDIPEDLSVFYDNETCIKSKLQKSGIGTELGQTRINQAIALGAVATCGRSINIPWLNIKERQFLAAGFSFAKLVPEGDTYQVDNMPRYFYLAQKP